MSLPQHLLKFPFLDITEALLCLQADGPLHFHCDVILHVTCHLWVVRGRQMVNNYISPLWLLYGQDSFTPCSIARAQSCTVVGSLLFFLSDSSPLSVTPGDITKTTPSFSMGSAILWTALKRLIVPDRMCHLFCERLDTKQVNLCRPCVLHYNFSSCPWQHSSPRWTYHG